MCAIQSWSIWWNIFGLFFDLLIALILIENLGDKIGSFNERNTHSARQKTLKHAHSDRRFVLRGILVSHNIWRRVAGLSPTTFFSEDGAPSLSAINRSFDELDVHTQRSASIYRNADFANLGLKVLLGFAFPLHLIGNWPCIAITS